ncbi:BQ2448_3325 [Microbotryum intermedium]|uniref:BQ2448_3325 protein n=1 Tax=Microbotryum intermedium TaxID=269621 RepID=A0A238FEZ0_9BASI|nr:BQ2448_3325 [Microbotryum intermedium]
MRHCTALKRVTLNDYAMHTKYSWQAWHRALDKQAAVASPIESLCSTLSWTRDALKLMACLGSELRELVIKGWEVVGPWLAQEEEFYEILRLNAVMPSARTGLVTFGLRKISVITRCEVSQGLIQSLPILVPMLEELYLAEEVDIFAKNIMNRGNDLTFSGLISGLNADSMKSLEIYAHPTGRLSLGTFEGVAGHLPKLTRLGGCSHYFSYQILIDIAQHGSVSWLCTHPDRDSEGGNESEDDEDKRALFQEETLESRAAVQEMGTIAEEMISLGVAWADEEGGSKGAVINKLMRLVRGRAQRRGASKGR